MTPAGRVLLGLVLAPLAAAAGESQGIEIDHRGIGCIVAGKYPRLFARLSPAERVARARLHFRPSGSLGWYYVPMAPEGYNFWGVLPKPQKGLKKLEYYISATDKSLGESRTPEYAPSVVSGPGGCEANKALAIAFEPKRSILVGAPEEGAGAPMVPQGFSADGVVSAGNADPSAVPGRSAERASTSSASAVAGAGGGRAAPASPPETGSGGLGTKTLLIAGGVVAAGGGVALAAKSHGNASPSASLCANLAPGASTLAVTIAQGAGGAPQFSWTPPCPVATLLVETAPDGNDLWSTQGNLTPPVAYGGPPLVAGRSYNVIILGSGGAVLGVLTFLP